MTSVKEQGDLVRPKKKRESKFPKWLCLYSILRELSRRSASQFYSIFLFLLLLSILLLPYFFVVFSIMMHIVFVLK